MSAQHTPGPWFADTADMFGDHNIVTGDQAETLAVAAVVSNMRSAVEVAANARLVAAAPALYEALSKAAVWFEQYAAEHYKKALTAPDGGEQHSREVKGKINADRAAELRATLAKATGAA